MPYKIVWVLTLSTLGLARASASFEQCGTAIPMDPPSAWPMQAGDDAERGCCILEGAPGQKCVYANRGFCRTKAGEAGVPHQFHANTSCGDLPQCRG